MATQKEATLIAAVQAAEGVRQTAKQAALNTYTAAGFSPAALVTYNAAQVAADAAYITAVDAASNTAGISLHSGYSGLFGGNIGSVAT